MSLPPPSATGEVLDAFLRGETPAVTEVRAWVRLAISPFRSRLGAAIEDLEQEVLAELLAALGAERASRIEHPRGFVFRVASRTAIDRWRGARRWRFEELADEAADPASLEALDRLLSAERRGDLLALFAALPRGCRELWRMILAGLSYREMSARLEVGEGALRVRVLRCRRRALALAGLPARNGSPGPSPGSERGGAR